MITILVRDWGRDESGPLMDCSACLIKTGMSLFSMAGHVILASKPLSAMRATELSVSSVNHTKINKKVSISKRI